MSAPSEVPASTAGLHVRAGNSMSRTRDGLLDGALSCIEREGLRRLTMSAVADRSGVAKATLYNHFRTKDDVLRALVRREVTLVCDAAALAAATGGAAVGLARAAGELAEHVAVRRVALEEPSALLPLIGGDPGDGADVDDLDPADREPAGPGDEGSEAGEAEPADPAETPLRAYAAGRTAAMLGVGDGDPLVEVVLRWLVSQLLAPQEPDDREAAAVLIASVAAARVMAR